MIHQSSAHPMSSDEEVCARVKRRIADRPELAAGVLVSVNAGTVSLSGAVSCYYHRQLAIEYAQHIPGVFHVVDEIDVIDRLPKRAK